MSAVQIREAIEKLSPAERLDLVEWLNETTPHEEDDAYLQETIAIAERRSEELRSGAVKAVPWEQVQRQLDEAMVS